MIRKNPGLPGILNVTTDDDEEELMNKARNEVMKKIGVTTWNQPASTDPVSFEEDLYTTTPMPKMTPIKEVKDEHGFTPKQNKEIRDYLTRPATNKEKEVDPIKKMVRKNMPILTYIDKISNIYDGKPRKYDDQGKLLDKTSAKPENKKWEYKSRTDELAAADKITDQLTKLKD